MKPSENRDQLEALVLEFTAVNARYVRRVLAESYGKEVDPNIYNRANIPRIVNDLSQAELISLAGHLSSIPLQPENGASNGRQTDLSKGLSLVLIASILGVAALIIWGFTIVFAKSANLWELIVVDGLAILIVVALNITFNRFPLIAPPRGRAGLTSERRKVTGRWKKAVAVSTVVSAVATIMQVILMIVYK
jgi:hypothetical protein